ncbi:Ulp1-like peptidase [Cucumis melo var. makuwa]|uniref:Ulp1-like peptidase n=1 Tax=Cucumis melo var. makuwa TaxID=1194695 RepID=A0A5D3DRB7_CUCMM|nr:Ulp1-like peptidase [Cucumis melo var. makuwa]TYK26092.1 Ulp1-like peptidase [Cucumis melo var. makuwa]
MNGSKLDKEYPTLNFESNEDAVKMSLFYFVELAMMAREGRQYMDWTMLGLLDDLEDFVSYDWGELIWIKALGSLKEALRGKVTMHKKKPPNKFPESYSLYGFPFTFQTYKLMLSISRQVANRAWRDAARIQAIEPIDEELVYLDQVLDIPFTEGYEDNPDAPLQDHDAPLSHLMASMKITHPSLDHCQPPLPIHPCKDNFDTLREIGRLNSNINYVSKQDLRRSMHGIRKDLPTLDAISDLLGLYLTIPDE